MKLEPKKNLEVIVKVLDGENNNRPCADFAKDGVLALQIIAPDETEIILEDFLPTGEPGEVQIQTSLEKVGTYKGMVMFNRHKVQGQGYADIVVAERKKLFGLF
uniref:Uncharacterized protein n=1 Tax=Paramoeba aestuarina TaxID=180227 RepID=A0A7S4UNS5_9EUKA|mmetsp:Transcript_5119/g.7678  ORF Transcript_5119/g.7678 Transcript_5119/m.7678 type:complete len:104 (+) Transcript_5119:246-557(+)